jgi:hypothetical protein
MNHNLATAKTTNHTEDNLGYDINTHFSKKEFDLRLWKDGYETDKNVIFFTTGKI